MQNKYEYDLHQLIYSENLGKTLKKNPELITFQDEDGRTLLHYAAGLGHLLGSSEISKIFDVLLNAPGINFNIQDKYGFTPLHQAALFCQERVTCNYVFPTFLKKAVEKGFDFSLVTHDKKLSVLHIAALNTYTNPLTGKRVNNVYAVLKSTKNPQINLLSSSGSSALFYALNQLHMDEVKDLLKFGANPLMFGQSDRSPLLLIDQKLQKCKNILNNQDVELDIEENQEQDEEYNGEAIQLTIEALNELKNFIKEIDHQKIRKNSRILSQGKRSSESPFSFFPTEILLKIASYTGHGVLTEKDADNIAFNTFGRPPNN